MEEDKADMMKLFGMGIKHRFTGKKVKTETLPRRISMKERPGCNICRRITYRFWKVLYSSVFFYYMPYLAFFANSYFQVVLTPKKGQA